MTPFAVVAGLALFRPLLSPKVLNEYGRGVILRPGRSCPGPKGPGLIVVAWPIDRMVRVSPRKPPVAGAADGSSDTTGGET
jgi:hypothetical protein